jgi:hypothetical protein
VVSGEVVPGAVVPSGEVAPGVIVPSGEVAPGVVVPSEDGAVSGAAVAPGVAPASLAPPVLESLGAPVDWLLRGPQAASSAAAAQRGIHSLVFM